MKEDVKEDVKGEPFLDDDHDWHEEINCYRWWAAFGPEECGEWKDEKEEVKEEVKELDLGRRMMNKCQVMMQVTCQVRRWMVLTCFVMM